MRTRTLTTLALLLALTVIGANISFLGSIALDSFPAFLGTLLLGPVAGAFLGGVGHLTSSLFAGFPLTLPIHIFIAVMMAATMYLYGLSREKTGNKFVSGFIAYFVNVFIELGLLIPILSWPVVASLFIPLSLATIVNIILTEIVYAYLPESIIGRFSI